MIAFIFLFVFRSLAGVHNGYGYAKNDMFRIATAIVMTLISIACGYLLLEKDINDFLFLTSPIRRNLGIVALLLTILGIWGVDNSFSKRYKFLPKDIHFWEMIKTGGITFMFLLGGWDFWFITAHLYPALILHKGFVNLGAGLNFFDVRTDDETGKTFNIPLLNIKIPREPFWLRAALAIVSIGFIIIKLL